MSGEIVNLRRERKRRARLAAGDAAEANRVSFGLSKAERTVLRAEHAAAARHLDGHVLQTAPAAPANPEDGRKPPRP